jgi:peptide/nickel transport system substrate-binding protein
VVLNLLKGKNLLLLQVCAPGWLLRGAKANNLASPQTSIGAARHFARKTQPNGCASTHFSRPVFWPIGQLLARLFRQIAFGFALAGTLAGCGTAKSGSQSAAPNAEGIPRGGALTVAVRTEPATFNRLRKRDSSTDLVGLLTQARLVRINHATDDVEPWLAESWTRTADGRRYTLKLRPNVTFSDGHPFTADDVLFTFAALYDPRTGSELVDALRLDGKNLEVSSPDPLTVVVNFPTPFAPGVRILDNLPILPKHKLQAAFDAGTFGSAWGLTTPPSEIAGLGPFVLSAYVPGQHMVFERNPRYFRRGPGGAALPYLDRITVEIVPDQDSQLLRLDSGTADLIDDAMRPQDYAPLKRAADAHRVKLMDLGVAYDAPVLWFNLKPDAFARDPRRAWIQRDELRRAISYAVDRKVFADTVYLGAGVPVFGGAPGLTPANKKWYSTATVEYPHDPAAAAKLLASIGLTDRNGDGRIEDAHNLPVRFSILTQKGKTALERGAELIREDLGKVGVTVDVVALDGKALIERFLSGTGYDAVYFSVGTTDTDPAINPDFWFSSGSAHFWNIGQKTPATDWERQVDELMTKQIGSTDDRERKALFDRVQQILGDHLPVIAFAAPRVFVAASDRVTNITPALVRPQILWAADTLAVTLHP